jgi:hypothetical protein
VGKIVEYGEGQSVGPHGCLYLKELPGRTRSSGRIDRTASFRCACGGSFESQIRNVKSGRTSSCGCKKNRWSGYSTDRSLYNVWRHMNQRCTDSKVRNYHRYGGRGIKVCDDWQGSFNTFREWAIANGWERGFQIDRIDNDGDYSPNNCRFVTREENCRNRSTNLYCELGGELMTLGEAAKRLGIHSGRLSEWNRGMHLQSKPQHLCFKDAKCG